MARAFRIAVIPPCSAAFGVLSECPEPKTPNRLDPIVLRNRKARHAGRMFFVRSTPNAGCRPSCEDRGRALYGEDAAAGMKGLSVVNAEEIDYWNATAGSRWAAWQDRIDAAFAPITAAAMLSAGAQSGEAVLDVGCGCGETVLGLANRVGSSGHVYGVDVSRPMLAVAKSRVGARERTNVTLLLSDASTHAFEPAALDLVFSRFGVMFFEHPGAAFANLRRASRPQGRLAFVCWRSLADNPWFYVPRNAVLPLVPAPAVPDPEAPGPMSFADPDRVRRVLAQAGYRAVEIDAFDTTVSLGARAGAVDFLLQIGPASRLLDGTDALTRAAAAERLDEAARDYESAAGVSFGAGVWLVRASA